MENNDKITIEVTYSDLLKMAQHNVIPKGFTNWALASKINWTIAHQAAYWGNLPKNFHKDFPDVWEMKDVNGLSVENLALEHGYQI